jgi:hypothetical protein
MQAVGAESGAVSWLECSRVLRLLLALLGTHRLENPTGVREAGRDGPYCRCGASEHPRPAPRMRYGTCLDLFGRSARKRIDPDNAYARKTENSPRLLHLQLRQSNLRKRSKGEKNLLNLLRAGGWASRLQAAK